MKNPTLRDPSRPLQKKKELFCKFYTFECWGDPAEAARRSGFSPDPDKLRALLCQPDVSERVRYLRNQIAEQTIADEAWIKRCFIEIIQNADKPADKLRALSALYRTLAEQKKQAAKTDGEPDFPFDCDEEI